MKFSQVFVATCIAGAAFAEAGIFSKIAGKAIGFLEKHHPHKSDLKKVGSAVKKAGHGAKKAGSAATKAAGGKEAAFQHASSVASYAAQNHQLHEEQKLARLQAQVPQRRAFSDEELIFLVARLLEDDDILSTRAFQLNQLE